MLKLIFRKTILYLLIMILVAAIALGVFYLINGNADSIPNRGVFV